MPQIRIYPNEQFKEIELDYSLKLRYAISNKGRLISFSENIEDCRLLKGSLSDGYPIFSFRIKKTEKLLANVYSFIN